MREVRNTQTILMGITVGNVHWKNRENGGMSFRLLLEHELNFENGS
jgi:hypothetical protein